MNAPVKRPGCVETTAMGAAYLAGLAVGYWKNKEEVQKNWAVDQVFYPEITEEERQSLGIQVEKEGGDTQWVSQYVYDEYGNLVYDETTWEPMTEMVEVDENGNVVSSESEDTSDNGSLYGNVTPPEPQGEQQIDENWSDGVTDQDLQIGTQ